MNRLKYDNVYELSFTKYLQAVKAIILHRCETHTECIKLVWFKCSTCLNLKS